jgi:hypothetical protein
MALHAPAPGCSKLRMLSLVSICLLALAGCGASASQRPATTASRTSSTASSPSSTAVESSDSSCTSALADSDVRVTIYGEGEAACKAWDRSASATLGGVWQPVAFAPDRSEAQVVCSMAKGSTLIEVRDTGNHAQADKICAALTRSHDSEAGVSAAQQAQKQAAAQRPGHAAAAARFSGEAASLHKRKQHEEALASADEAQAEHMVSRADQVEAEETGEGGSKQAQADRIRAGSQGARNRAQAHQANAARLKREAEGKEADAERERVAAAPPPVTWLPG